MFWSDTSAEFKRIPYCFMFIFQSGFRILGLAVDFGSQSLFWSDTSPEFKGIHRGNLDGKNVTTIVKGEDSISINAQILNFQAHARIQTVLSEGVQL